MAFDFNGIIKDKNKGITNAMHTAWLNMSYKILIQEIEDLNIFRQYDGKYRLKADEINHCVMAYVGEATSPFKEPRYIFKFIQEHGKIKIVLYLRGKGSKLSSSKTVYVGSSILWLIKHSKFEFAYCYVIDEDGNICDKAYMEILNISTTTVYDEFIYRFYIARFERLSEEDEDSILTDELVEKLPVFMNITNCTFTRGTIFGSVTACRKLIKKLSGNIHAAVKITGYTADSIFKQRYKTDVNEKFITVYNIKSGKSISTVGLK